MNNEDGKKIFCKIYSIAVSLACVIAFIQFLSGTTDYFVRGGFPNNHVYALYLLISLPFLFFQIIILFRSNKVFGVIVSCFILVCASVTIRDTGHVIALLLEVIFILYYLRSFLPKYIFISTIILISLLHISFHKNEFKSFINLHEVSDVSGAFEKQYWLTEAEFKNPVTLKFNRYVLKTEMAFMPVDYSYKSNMEFSFSSDIPKQRYVEWIAAGSLLSSNPVFGVGPGNYQSKIGEYYLSLPKLSTSEPDTQNGWLVLGSTVGIVGMAILMMVLATGILNINKYKSLDHNSLFGLSLSIASVGILFGAVWSPFFQTGIIVPLSGLFAVISETSNEGKYSGILSKIGIGNKIVILFALCAIILLSFHIFKKSDEEQVYIWLEGEKADSIIEPMTISRMRGASKNSALNIPRGSGAGWRGEAGGKAVYNVDLSKDSMLNLWMRTQWTDGCGNTFFVSVNNGKKMIIGNDAIFNTWHWVSIGNLSLKKGRNLIEISNREDGVALDKILLTNDNEFKPRLELRNFFDGFGGCDGNNDASWESKSGLWKVIVEPIEGLKDSYSQLNDGVCVVLAGDTNWNNYNISCMVRSGGENGLGIFSYYLDEKNYDLIRWASPGSRLSYSGKIEYVCRKEGNETIIASVQYPLESDRWYEVERIAKDDIDMIYIDGEEIFSIPRQIGYKGKIGLYSEENPGSFFDNVNVDFL